MINLYLQCKNCKIAKFGHTRYCRRVVLWATLATGTPARRLQGVASCDARSLVAVWHFAIVSVDYCRLVADALGWRVFHNAPNMRYLYVVISTYLPSATSHSQLLDPDYGTVFHRTRKRQIYRTIHCVHEKNNNPRQCKIEMSNLNTS